MSLINDALKRASQTAPGPTASQAEIPSQPLRPVEYRNAPPLWSVYLFPGLLVLFLAIGGWLVFRNSSGSFRLSRAGAKARVMARAQEPVPPAKAEASSSAPAKAPVAEPALSTGVVNSKETARPAEQPRSEPFPAAIAQEKPAAPVLAAALPPSAPVYKLQGIFFRPARPLAMVNGRNVQAGDKVGNARVVSIQRDSVTLSVDGETKVLTLSQNQ